MPVSSRRRRRSAVAGPDRPIRRASSAIRSRGAAWSSAAIRRSTASSWDSGISKAWRTKSLRFNGISILSPPLLFFIIWSSASYAAPVLDRPQAKDAATSRSAGGPGRGVSAAAATSGAPPAGRLDRLPPQSFFLVSAGFHYLGPSLAVLLFARLDVLGVAWLRIASAAVVFAAWRRPWRLVRKVRSLGAAGAWTLLALGAVLAVMNSAFYLAIDRLPLSTVGAIEFLGTVILAAAGARTVRNAGALALTTAGVIAITAIRITGQPLGFAFAFANCVLFMLYVVLGHRIANASGEGGEQGEKRGKGEGPAGSSRPTSMDRLAAAMLIAAVAATPWGLGGALPAFWHPVLLLAGAGVGVCSSVIPYVTDQLAMARLPRATFSLMLALLPVFATMMGAIVLRQLPTAQDVAGISLVVAGVALHRQAPRERT